MISARLMALLSASVVLVGLAVPNAARAQGAPPPVVDWSGLYVGAGTGYFFGNTTQTFGPRSFIDGNSFVPAGSRVHTDVNGGWFGGHFGYQQQFGRWVLGGQLELSGGDIGGTTSCPGVEGISFTAEPTRCHSSLRYMASASLRVGYAFERWLVYGLAGVVRAETRTEVRFPNLTRTLASSDVHTGVQAGLGVEYAILPSVSLRLEYKHIWLGDTDHEHYRFGSLIHRTPTEFDPDVVQASVTFKLGNPASAQFAAAQPGDIAPPAAQSPVQAASAPQQAAPAPQTAQAASPQVQQQRAARRAARRPAGSVTPLK
ncbi:MAG: porin family protein [Hyphomicrobiaceae bacterium]|nr:porin family protein [Hyphomicrobiaceae bacterium]